MLCSCNMSNDQKKKDKSTKNDIQHTSQKNICFSCLINHLIFNDEIYFYTRQVKFRIPTYI